MRTRKAQKVQLQHLKNSTLKFHSLVLSHVIVHSKQKFQKDLSSQSLTRPSLTFTMSLPFQYVICNPKSS